MKQPQKKRRTRRMSTSHTCGPMSRKNKILKNSCFTKPAVELLVNYYNKMNPGEKMKPDMDIHILTELRKQSRCDNNDMCLIQKFVANKREANIIKALIFPPKKPSGWKKDPDMWLSDTDISDVLNQYEKAYSQFSFIGPSSIDYDTIIENNKCVCQKLCNFQLAKYANEDTKHKIGIIFNLDTHDKGGSHWVSLFIDLEDNFVFYFDSTGSSIPKSIKRFTDNVINQGQSLNPPRNISFHQNNTMEHQKTNTECGMYCLYFIITMLLREQEISYDDHSESNKKHTKTELIEYFQGKSPKGRILDSRVFKKRNEYFLNS